MRKNLWKVLVLALCLALLVCGCAKKKAEEKDLTRGGVMGDIYLTVTSADAQVSGIQVSALQTDVTLTQNKYANVYEVGGKLNYQEGFTAFSDDEVLRNGYYLSFDICAGALDVSAAEITVKSGALGTARTFSGADFKEGKLTVTERILSSDGRTYDNIYVTFDLDGAGTEYRAETYTMDLSAIDATLKIFAFGEYPFSEYYSVVTLEEFIEEGQKLVAVLDYVGFSSTSTSSTIDMYELFSNPSGNGDYGFSKLTAATNTKSKIEANAYDYILLQSGRYYPVKDATRQKQNVDAAVKLCELAVKLNPSVRAVIVAPYGYQTFFKDYFPASTGVTSNTKHIAAIDRCAEEIVAKIKEKKTLPLGDEAVKISYVGKAFSAYGDSATIRTELYGEKDELTNVATNANQASALGAYLTAATMYADLFSASPVGINALGFEMEGFGCNLDGDDAKVLEILNQYSLTPYEMALKLQKVAHKSVFGAEAEDEVYTVNFETFDGAQVESVTAAMGNKYTAPADPTREGYIFKGWFRNKELDQKVEFVAETMQLGGETFYAAWQKMGDTSYIVEHYIENADGSYSLYKTDLDRVAQADSLVSGTLFGVPGYVYNPLHPDGRASAYVSADFNAKIKLYYDRGEYTITYAYNAAYMGMPALPEATTAKFGDVITVAAPGTVEDYSFTGWAADNAAVIGGKFTMPAGDVALTGDWYETAVMPTIALPKATELHGKAVADIQENITVDGFKVFGNSKHNMTYPGYTALMDTSTMIQPEYAEAKYGYGNYVALNITFPADATDESTITFKEGTDERVFTAADGKSFDVVLRIMDTYNKITFAIDMDGDADTYIAQDMILDLSGLTKAYAKGFEEVYQTALAYKARGAAFQYDSASMTRTYANSGLGQMRYDRLAPAEMASWQYTLQLDCSSWLLANFINSIGYDFEGGYDCATFCSMPTTNAYAHINTNKETTKEKDAIMAEWRSILQPGDVMVYRYANGAGGHVMLYIGDNKMIHCSGDGYYDGKSKNNHTGEINKTLTGKAYDVDEAKGAMPIDKITTLMQHDTRLGMMSSTYPKGRFAIIRPYSFESNAVTPYGELHTTYPDLYIEKTTSHPQGHSVAIGEEFTMYIRFENRGAKDITLEVENYIPENSKLVKGLEKQTVKLNSYDSKTIEVTYVIEESVFTYFEDNFTRRLYFGTKVNGAEINQIAIQVGKTLTDEQIAKLQAVDFASINAADSFTFIKEVYKQAFGYELQLDGSKDLAEMISKVIQPVYEAMAIQIPYESENDSYAQLVDGLYGGIHLKSADEIEHAFRIKKLTSLNLQPGDILTTSGHNRGDIRNYNADAKTYLYIGDSKFLTINSYGKLQTIYADGYTQYFLKTTRSEIYLTDLLAQLPGEACYFILRPAQIME
ncbi:MAG: InlB B-repeat-containing protein [Clostridia bacterium]|nr:InlB B-repeat-containing protein [Clostridia bacterium]